MLQLDTYIFFDGNCAEAMRFYERTPGGELMMMTHAESPVAAQTLAYPTVAEAKRVFDALAEGGQVTMPFP